MATSVLQPFDDHQTASCFLPDVQPTVGSIDEHAAGPDKLIGRAAAAGSWRKLDARSHGELEQLGVVERLVDDNDTVVVLVGYESPTSCEVNRQTLDALQVTVAVAQEYATFERRDRR